MIRRGTKINKVWEASSLQLTCKSSSGRQIQQHYAALPTTWTLTPSFPGASEHIKQIPAIYRATLSYLIGKDSGILSLPMQLRIERCRPWRGEQKRWHALHLLGILLLPGPADTSARTRTNTASICQYYTGFKQELRLGSNRTTDSMLAMSPASPLSAGDGIATDCAETVVSSPTYDGTFHSRPLSGRPPTWEMKNGLCHSTPTVTVESLVEMYGKYASVQIHYDFKSIALNQMPKNSVWWKITAVNGYGAWASICD